MEVLEHPGQYEFGQFVMIHLTNPVHHICYQIVLRLAEHMRGNIASVVPTVVRYRITKLPQSSNYEICRSCGNIPDLKMRGPFKVYKRFRVVIAIAVRSALQKYDILAVSGQTRPLFPPP